MLSSSTIVLHLSLIDGAGPGAVQRLLAHCGDNLAQLYDYSIADFMAIGVTSRLAQKLVDGLADTQLLEKELLLIERNQIQITTLADSSYPVLLKNIHIPPTVLYWRGTLPVDTSLLAIVGSRDANDYGKKIIDELVPALVGYGWNIVSGGARGADTMAHQATLNAGGKTVAILGSGLLIPYPIENIHLFETMIAAGGALASPFPLLMEPLPNNFPARNRVIAGMSRGCLVIQAAIQSGARITADYCLQQGREVFAIPGSLDDPLSAGCHAVIQQGAKLTTCVGDIVAEFGQVVDPIIVADTALQKESGILQRSSSFGSMEREARMETSPLGPAALYRGERINGEVYDDSLEGIIIRFCKNPCSVDELLIETGLPLIEMTQILFDLQLKGKICQNMSGLWEKR
jgi:DNA processing protein